MATASSGGRSEGRGSMVDLNAFSSGLSPDRFRFGPHGRARVNPRPAGPSPDPTLCWGGGGAYRPPHLSRKPTDVGEKFKRQWKGLDEIFQIKFENLTSRSPVTSQVRSNTKCLTFPFNAFPRQNAGNKRISSR